MADEALDYCMNITDPNQNSGNFKPIERTFKSGTQREMHLRLVEEGLKKLKVRGTTPSDVERLHTRCQVSLKRVMAFARDIVAAHEVDGKHIDKGMLTMTLFSFLLTELQQFDKDEQHILMANFLAVQTASEFR